MEKHYKRNWLSSYYRVLVLSLTVLFASSMAMAQISGNFTINKGAAASSTNFQSFAAFKTALGSGVSDAVTVNVVKGSGPYTEKISFTAVSGASATNTITIIGNGEEITTSSSGYVIQFNGADYFTLDGLVIDHTGTGSGTRCVHFRSGADYNTVKNSELIISNYGSTSNSTAYVAFSNSNTSNTSTGEHGAHNLVDNNTMHGGSSTKGPYYGIVDYRSDNGSLDNNQFTNNDIRDVYYYFTYFRYCNGVQVVGNNLHHNRSNSSYGYAFYGYYMGTSTVANRFDNNDIHDIDGNYAYAGYFYRSAGTTANPTSMSGNKFHDNSGLYCYGFRMYYYCDNAEVNDNEIYNNSADYYMYYGVQTYYSTNVTMNGNSVHDNTAGYYMYYAFYFYYCSDSEMLNNSFYNNAAGYGNLYCLYNGYCDNTTIAHNTWVIMDDVDYYNYILYVYYYQPPTNLKIHNNILQFKSATGFGYQYPIYCYYNTDKIDWANNVVNDLSGGTKYYYANNATYSSFSAWAAAADDNTSIEADPKFVNLSAGNIKPSNPVISNMGTQGLADKDAAGVTRTACGPDPGAYEFTVNHTASNFTFAATDECGGYMEEITFDFTNGTAVAMTDVEVFYQINGETPVIETIDSVPANSTVTYSFDAIPEFNTAGTNTVECGLLCDDNTADNVLTKYIDITPSPSGFTLDEGTTFPGYFRQGASGGKMTNPDVTVPGQEIEYDVMNPTKYPTSDYGTAWTAAASAWTSGGMAVTTGAPVFDNTDMTLTFDPDASLADSLVFVNIVISDLNSGCDSISGRWVYVPHT
ncbi:MAG: hypothetical protein ACI8ZN_002072, partial [Bacteroidia bacterium]